MTNHDLSSSPLGWVWRVLFAASTVALVGSCGERPDLTTVTASDEQTGPADGGESSNGQQPGEPEAQTEAQIPDPEQPGGEAPADPGGGQEPGSDEAGDGETGTAGTDEPVGSVDETETGGGGPAGPVAGPGEVGGFWWSRESKWATVIDEVFDMCDDSEAMIAVTGRRPSPGDDDITNDPTWRDRARDEILKFKPAGGCHAKNPVGCVM